MRYSLFKHRLMGGFILTLLGLASHSAFPGPPSRAETDRQQTEPRPQGDEQRRPFKTKPVTAVSTNTDRNSATSSNAGSVTVNRPQYSLRRGLEFALDVQLGSKSAGDPRWSGRPYLRVMYPHQNQMPALVMVIGKLECSEPANSGWTRNPNGDIRFPDFLWITEHGPLTTTLATIQSPHRLPRQLSAIFPYEELLFPRLPRHNELDHRSGAATCYLSTSGELTGASSTSIDLTRNSGGYRVVSSSGFFCAAKETGLKFEQVTNFDPKDALLIDSTLDYVLRSQGDSTVTATIRRLRRDEVSVARNQSINNASSPQERHKFLGRIPVELDRIPKTFPKHGPALLLGERVLCADAFVVENRRLEYWFYGRMVRHLDEHRALVRLDGSDEFLEANYSSIKKSP